LEYLFDLLPKYPNAELLWRCIEAHPRHEEPEHKPWVDLIVRGCWYLKDIGGDELAYIKRIYKAHFDENLNVEDVAVLVKCAADIGVSDTVAFEAALSDAKYEKAQLDANDYAYEQKGVWAVPTFVCGDIRLDAIGGIGVTKNQLDTFLSRCCS